MNWKSPPDHFTATVVWYRIVRPEGAFVREEAFGQVVEYGPMQEAMMVPLINERKKFFETYLTRWRKDQAGRWMAEITAAGKPGFFSKDGNHFSIY